MAIQKQKLYLMQYVDYRAPLQYATCYAEHEMDHVKGTAVLLGEISIEIEFPEADQGIIAQLQIESLNEQISKERAESQARVNILLDRISKLTCITHDSGAE